MSLDEHISSLLDLVITDLKARVLDVKNQAVRVDATQFLTRNLQ